MTAFKTVLALSCLALAQDRLPVPDGARLKKSEAEVREVFKADYAKQTPADRRSLAQRLLQNAVETRDDPTARYVLLREASALAAPAGDLPTGLRAIDELAFSHQVEPLSLKLAFLAEAAKAAKTPEERRLLTDAYLVLLHQAVAAEAFEVAEPCASAAVASAKLSQDLPLFTRVEARAREIAAARKAAEDLQKLRETLRKTPDDAAANLAVGRRECFARGNWTAGLPLLLKCGDPALSELAARDLANPASADEQAALGDAWWAHSEKESGDAAIYARKRAATWYLQARDRLSHEPPAELT